ncbi:MAG: methyltransferase domain-containing protein [Deltaproteobacteria bacterium]|nr:methyltransferase domain-containing protein [Deltaproteobacteria bacterium]
MTAPKISPEKDPADRPDVVSIMAEIRERIKNDVAAHADKKLPFKSFKADIEGKEAKSADEVVNSEELRNLNRMYAYSTRLNLDSLTSHRAGFFGKLIVKLKQKFLKVLWESILKDYLTSEREYQSNLVRFLNDVSKYIGARDSSVFWELIRKIDYDVGKALERIERINDEQSASMRALERRTNEALDAAIRKIQAGGVLDQHEEKLRVLENVTRGLEGVVSKLPVSRELPSAPQSAAAGTLPGDFSYLLLENRFRGSEADISKRLEIYPPLFANAKKPVLEIGSGRGELQLLFRKAAIKSYGVDMDEAMVAHARDLGVEATLGDGIAHLRSLEDRSLGGLIAIQVVEHLPRQTLQELFTLSGKKVERGGRVIFETINPRSLLALSSNYFRDPTHVWPLHPDTLEYCAQLAGLKVVEVRLLSPIAAGAQLQEIAIDEHMPPRWAGAFESVNRNIKQLNTWLYGHQDYCIIAEAQ